MRLPWRRPKLDLDREPDATDGTVSEESVQAERDDLWDRYIQAHVDLEIDPKKED